MDKVYIVLRNRQGQNSFVKLFINIEKIFLTMQEAHDWCRDNQDRADEIFGIETMEWKIDSYPIPFGYK